MEEPNKHDASDLPQLSLSAHPADLFMLHQILTESDSLYTEERIDPHALHFIPENTWSQQMVSLQFLHDDYFGRKNNVNRRFEHKLWNALLITENFPDMTKLVGVTWATDTVIKVYKFPFAKLLNITAIDGGLFHKQGNFPRHGFVILNDVDAKEKVPKEQQEDVDFRDVMLITHASNCFTRQSSEALINQCKWVSPGGVTRVATLRPATLSILP